LRRVRFDGKESGAVAVLVAMLLVVFMGCAAIAVDLGREQVVAAQLQKAADAGALAGAVYLPGDLPTAQSVAKSVALQNVRVGLAGPVTVTSVVGARPTQLVVTVSGPMTFVFGQAIGISGTTVTRAATADFAGPTPMGSPCNVFGREDMAANGESGQSSVGSSNCAGAGTYWVNMAGYDVNKARGDAFAAGWCTDPDDGKGIDGCSIPNSTAANPGTNTQYDPNGYVYTVRVTQPGLLTLQGYDMAWVATGDHCSDNLAGASGVTNSFVPTAADAKVRYATGDSAYCTGDTQAGYPEGDDSILSTRVTVRNPAATSINPLDGTPLCNPLNLKGWGVQYDAPSTYARPNPKVITPLNLSALLNGKSPSYDSTLAEYFHRWAPLCPGSVWVTPGDYSIQVQTFNGGGQNRFAIRASLSSGNQYVSVFANGKESVFNNVNNGTSEFFLVRLGSGTASHTLTLGFFDMGDATKPVSATVLQPDSSTLAAGQPWPGCIGIGPTGGPAPGSGLSQCTVTTTAATNGGRWQYVQVPIPANYECNQDADQSKCWVKIRLTTAAAQADTTTWTASMDGDPVRIIH
jgi:hypothetical protein